MACYQGYGPEAVKLLVAAGADPMMHNKTGLSALGMTANQVIVSLHFVLVAAAFGLNCQTGCICRSWQRRATAAYLCLYGQWAVVGVSFKLAVAVNLQGNSPVTQTVLTVRPALLPMQGNWREMQAILQAMPQLLTANAGEEGCFSFCCV